MDTRSRDLLVEAMSVVHSAFGEYACGAMKHLPQEEKDNFERNFAERARMFMHNAAVYLKQNQE
ncbi:MAG: hypothetical protein KGL39_12215 [Patescibacteria group bacterium]|nr:hypothetical protein [Patescibacteria group bacterium]